MSKRQTQKKRYQEESLAAKLGNALKTALKNGVSVEIKVKKDENADPFGEPYPEIPDWLRD